MFDLGEYASNILWSYAVSIVLVAGFVALSIRRQKKLRRELNMLNEEKNSK